MIVIFKVNTFFFWHRFSQHQKRSVKVMTASYKYLLFPLKLSTKIMYICGKCNFTICTSVIFPISMQKTVRPQIGPVKKKNSQLIQISIKEKRHDPNPWFSGIIFFLWIGTLECPSKKRNLMGCLFFDDDFGTFFSFWPIKSTDLQNPGSQSKI